MPWKGLQFMRHGTNGMNRHVIDTTHLYPYIFLRAYGLHEMMQYSMMLPLIRLLLLYIITYSLPKENFQNQKLPWL